MIYLASFKGTKSGWQGSVERFTRFVTKSEYSHTEVCIGNPFESEVICVSSVGTEGGVRPKTQQLSPSDWDIVKLPKVSVRDVLDFLKEHENDGYDIIGCVRSILPFVSHEHPTKYFCSEVAATIMKLKDPWRYHPGVLHCVASSL